MLLPIFNGALVGLTLAFMIGPALFMLLQTSMLRGFKAGVSFAFGVFLSDGLVLSLVYFSFSKLVGTDPRENMLFNIIGGIVLIIFGTITFLKKSNSEARADVRNSIINDEPSPPYVYAIKGFFLNIANPGIWFIWITAMVAVSTSYSGQSTSIIIFFGSTLCTVLLIDSLKAFISTKLSAFLSPTVIPTINKIVGVILCVVGVFLIVNLFYDLESMIEEQINAVRSMSSGLLDEDFNNIKNWIPNYF